MTILTKDIELKRAQFTQESSVYPGNLGFNT